MIAVAVEEAAAEDSRLTALLSSFVAWTTIHAARETMKQLKRDYDKTEDDLKALQSVGQIIGETLKQLDDERCESSFGDPPSFHPSILSSESL